MITNPKEIIAYISDKRHLSQIVKDNSLCNNAGVNRAALIMETNKKYINASTAYRNHSAKMLKTLRNLYPYKPENYSEAKEMYESYLKQGMITSFENLKVGDWVTALDNHAPVKGKRFAEYYVNYNSEGNVGEAYQIEKFYGDGDTCSVADSDMGLMLGQFRKATDSEIETKIQLVHQRKIAAVQNQIEYHQKSINDLNNKLSKLM